MPTCIHSCVCLCVHVFCVFDYTLVYLTSLVSVSSTMYLIRLAISHTYKYSVACSKHTQYTIQPYTTLSGVLRACS